MVFLIALLSSVFSFPQSRSSSLEDFVKMDWSDYFEDVRKPQTVRLPITEIQKVE